LPFGESGLLPVPEHKEVMPPNFEEMVAVARTLSEGFSFLRVDLYNVSGKIYFGELTFFPASGMLPFVPDEADFEIGKMLNVRTNVSY
jgi:hypothetical protein